MGYLETLFDYVLNRSSFSLVHLLNETKERVHNSHSRVHAEEYLFKKLDKKCNNNQLRLKRSMRYAWQFIISYLLNVTLELPFLHPYKVSDGSRKELVNMWTLMLLCSMFHKIQAP